MPTTSPLAVALPDIERDFDAGVDTVQWVINAYALIFGVLIVTGGRLADLFGRRRVFLIGSMIFTVFSLFAGIAPNVVWLIIARAFMGVGGAMMWPAVLAMTFAVLPKSRAALASGIVLGARRLRQRRGTTPGRRTDRRVDRSIDYAGVLTLSGGLIALLVALDEGADLGWGDTHILGLFGLCILLLGSFVVIERRSTRAALVPHDVFANRTFRMVCLAVLLMSVTFFSALMYLPQFMEKILGWSALTAGLGLLPMMATFAVTAFFAGPLYERVGAKRLLTIGALCLLTGAALIAWAASSSSWATLVPGMALLGLGSACSCPRPRRPASL